MTTTAEVPTRTRVGAIDAIRGAAIGLMVLDHVLVQVDPTSPLRSGSPFMITRLSLPLFMLAAAAVWRPPQVYGWRRVLRRWAILFVAGVAETMLYTVLGMSTPGIIAVFLWVQVLVDVAAWALGGRFGPVAAWSLGVLFLLQALYWKLDHAGYQEGLVGAWWVLGYLALGSHPVGAIAVGRVGALAWVGRHPWVWYFGHLLVLLFVFGPQV